ncbi:unnamed protein product [Hyaloperonospora brassicae]|uniref:glutathione gamma-glutamylcysteinyltransferase n=1 Tax=Hyaloperonospora brassicae TaxID=162125 RepID=A0AAV0UML2_HYABA|nr:unnamed protein product [Hyaloperonospora brassicae]
MDCKCPSRRDASAQQVAPDTRRHRPTNGNQRSATVSSSTSASSNGPRSFHRRHLPQECIAFSSPEGRQLFVEAVTRTEPTNYMQIYFPLAEQFTTQAEPAFCGLATLAMCLNALGVDPGRRWKGPWRWFSEELFDCCKPLLVAREQGINMAEFTCLARCNGVATDAIGATSAFTLAQFRAIVQRSCATSTEIVVLNYSRRVLGQSGDGHFSPIGGYHVERDLVLLLDVARFKYPPHWVQLSRVFDAMQCVDASVNAPRGLVVLTKGPSVWNGVDTCEAAAAVYSLRRTDGSGGGDSVSSSAAVL